MGVVNLVAFEKHPATCHPESLLQDVSDGVGSADEVVVVMGIDTEDIAAKMLPWHKNGVARGISIGRQECNVSVILPDTPLRHLSAHEASKDVLIEGIEITVEMVVVRLLDATHIGNA